MELRSTTQQLPPATTNYQMVLSTTIGMDHQYLPSLRHLSVHACTLHLTRVYQLVWSQVGG